MRAGDVVAERFEIQREAGAGGMSLVFLARDRLTSQSVAVKILSGREEGASQRFVREVQFLAELRHPAIVRYVDHGVLPSGQRFLAMEWLSGEELSTRLQKVGLSINEVLALGRAVADALGHAHRKGVVHRDIKPGNLFLVDGRIDKVKVLDFGIARAMAGAHLTVTRTRIGTPSYMSPDQARGMTTVDPRSDS